MEKKYKKGICLCVSLFIVCISAGFIAVNVMSSDGDIEYESFNTGHKTDMTKKGDYKKAEMEMRLQDTIQLIAEGSDPLVRIHNFNSADHSETTVDVTLYTDPYNEITEETQTEVENQILGSFNGILKDNISINIDMH